MADTTELTCQLGSDIIDNDRIDMLFGEVTEVTVTEVTEAPRGHFWRFWQKPPTIKKFRNFQLPPLSSYAYKAFWQTHDHNT